MPPPPPPPSPMVFRHLHARRRQVSVRRVAQRQRLAGGKGHGHHAGAVELLLEAGGRAAGRQQRSKVVDVLQRKEGSQSMRSGLGAWSGCRAVRRKQRSTCPVHHQSSPATATPAMPCAKPPYLRMLQVL